MQRTARGGPKYDLSHPIAGLVEIRAAVPFLRDIEAITAVAEVDPSQNRIVGYKDVAADEPGVSEPTGGNLMFSGALMCEAVKQLASYYLATQKAFDPNVVMCLGGIEKAKFLRPVQPGDRLVIVVVGLKIDPRRSRFSGVGTVGKEKVFETTVVLVPAPPATVVRESVEELCAQLRELEAGLPEPDREAICADCRWVEANWGKAGLAPYQGQFVAVLDEAVAGHGADSLVLQRDVARARNVHPQRLVVVYVAKPGL